MWRGHWSRKGKDMRDEELRLKLAEYGQRLMAEGLVTGPGGNLSARAGNIIYLSSSGLAFDEMGPEDYVGVDLNSGEVIEGKGRATSEYLVHLACYRKRSDIGAVVHTHPRYTVALSSAGHDIKAMFPDFHIYTHSKIPHIDYITVNTQELADAVEAVGVELVLPEDVEEVVVVAQVEARKEPRQELVLQGIRRPQVEDRRPRRRLSAFGFEKPREHQHQNFQQSWLRQCL